jgi:hypothetical protein
MKISSIIGKLIAGLNRPVINNEDINGTVSPYGNGVKLEAIGQIELVPYSANSTAKGYQEGETHYVRLTFPNIKGKLLEVPYQGGTKVVTLEKGVTLSVTLTDRKAAVILEESAEEKERKRLINAAALMFNGNGGNPSIAVEYPNYKDMTADEIRTATKELMKKAIGE